MLDTDLRKAGAVLCLLGMLLLAMAPVRYVYAEGKEILLVNGNKSEDKTYAIPKRDLAIMMKKLRSYVYEEYGKGDCDDLPELDDDHTFLAGSFTRPHAKQYITVVFRGIIFQKGATPCSKHGISLRDYYPNMVME